MSGGCARPRRKASASRPSLQHITVYPSGRSAFWIIIWFT